MVIDIRKDSIWTIKQIEELGFKLIQNDKQWCRFRGHGFDVLINLDTTKTKGNQFNFHSLGNNLKGYFSARINNKAHFMILLDMII